MQLKTLTAGIGLTLILGCKSLSPGWRGVSPSKHARSEEVVLETTGYCSCGTCCGWKRNWFGRPVYSSGSNEGRPKRVGYTASGKKAQPGSLAADTRIFPFGTIIFIPGYGYGRVEDRGGDIQGCHIDLYFLRHADAVAWGRVKKKVRVWTYLPDEKSAKFSH